DGGQRRRRDRRARHAAEALLRPARRAAAAALPHGRREAPMRSMRRGLFLTALVTLLCALSGCFWLEPVYGVTGPDGSVDAGDGGTDGGTDAGSDGGTDGGCGTEALPAAAELL